MSPSFSNPIECPLIPLFFILVLADGVEGTQRPARRLLPLLGGWAWVEALGPESCPPPGHGCVAWAELGPERERLSARQGPWNELPPGLASEECFAAGRVGTPPLPHDGSGVRVSAACLEVPGRPGQRR